MLPGFRFLFAAIVMCMSVLVFGLGATALMRAAHEDFATNTSWRAPPEPRFAQQDEPARTPVLAVLSVQPRATEPAAAPKEADPGTAVAPADGAAPSRPSGPETTAALSPATSDAAKPDNAASEPPGQAPAQVSAQADDQANNTAASTPPPVQTEVQPPAVTAASAPKIDASDDSRSATPATESATIGKAQPLAGEPAAPAPQQLPAPAPALADAPATLVLDEAAARIATLGGPPVPIADAMAALKTSDAKSDRDAINKKLEAERAKERHRLAVRRARLAQQAAAEQAANPFAPHPLIGTPTMTAR